MSIWFLVLLLHLIVPVVTRYTMRIWVLVLLLHLIVPVVFRPEGSRI